MSFVLMHTLLDGSLNLFIKHIQQSYTELSFNIKAKMVSLRFLPMGIAQKLNKFCPVEPMEKKYISIFYMGFSPTLSRSMAGEVFSPLWPPHKEAHWKRNWTMSNSFYQTYSSAVWIRSMSLFSPHMSFLLANSNLSTCQCKCSCSELRKLVITTGIRINKASLPISEATQNNSWLYI